MLNAFMLSVVVPTAHNKSRVYPTLIAKANYLPTDLFIIFGGIFWLIIC